jgi:hypothetical protein
MRGERQLLRLGEYLVRRASRQLPRKTRGERYTEWAAELPVILRDPQVRPAPRRAIRMLAYAADTFRGTTLTRVRSRRRRLELAMAAVLRLLLVACLALVTWIIWTIAREPGQPLNYLQLAWCLLLVAWEISMLVRPAARSTKLMVAGNLMGMAYNLAYAAQHRGDWVNYLLAAGFVLVLAASLLAVRWAHARQGSASRRQA